MNPLLTNGLLHFLIPPPLWRASIFLDPLPWSSAYVDEFPAYPWNSANFLQISSLPHGISTDFYCRSN
jgi:hypothetical protein